MADDYTITSVSRTPGADEDDVQRLGRCGAVRSPLAMPLGKEAQPSRRPVVVTLRDDAGTLTAHPSPTLLCTQIRNTQANRVYW